MLIGEFEFTEWTREGTLRQSAFKGLRDDKDPREVDPRVLSAVANYFFLATDEKGVRG